VDVLSFGAECGDLAKLEAVARVMNDADFQKAWQQKLKSKADKEKGYARLLTECLMEHGATEDASFCSLPNNILAISYVFSLLKQNSHIVPHTIKRQGDDQSAPQSEIFAGATYLRELLSSGEEKSFLAQISKETHPIWEEALKEGLTPVREERLSPILLSHLCLCDASPETVFADCGGGVLPLLKKSAKSVSSYEELIRAATTKKYTAARIRRAALFSYFGVTPAMIKSKPLYTQVLAMDGVGRSLLARIRKTTGISLLTKPADLGKLSAAAQAQAAFSYRADSIYALLSPKAQSMDIFLRTAPYLK
jgi:predicted nucleotidyltransferase